MTSPRRLAIPDIAVDPELVRRLIGEGETLFVERKRTDPRQGLGATLASFANTLGGWLLIGIDDDGSIVGYEPPGRVDLQDHVRQLARAQVDPAPPFATTTVELDGKRVGVVRVGESSDTPHITRDGVIYIRTHGGKQRVTDYRDIVELARRGDVARKAAVQRLLTLPLVEEIMRTPERIYGDNPGVSDDELWPLQQAIVRASPYTIGGDFADRALSESFAKYAELVASSLAPRLGQGPHVQVRARGTHYTAIAQPEAFDPIVTVDVVVDAGGVVALRLTTRNDPHIMQLVPVGWFSRLVRGASSLLERLDAYGRASVGLELRGASGLYMALDNQRHSKLNADDLIDGDALRLGGDVALPADSDDVQDVVDRWTRELARAARLPAWEPPPEQIALEARESDGSPS